MDVRTDMRALRLATGALVVFALAGCGKGAPPPAAKEAASALIAVDTIAVAPAELVEEVAVVGTLVPRAQAEIKSDIPGRIVEIPVREWVRVRRGDPLARVDTREVDSQIAKARTAIELAKANLAAAEAGRAEADVAAEQARRELERLRGLKDAGLATQQSLDDAGS
ncbi:MAG TPA: biotin/lipoyl-binding protein, partial [bacterium]